MNLHHKEQRRVAQLINLYELQAPVSEDKEEQKMNILLKNIFMTAGMEIQKMNYKSLQIISTLFVQYTS
jgi:hypothetical protein